MELAALKRLKIDVSTFSWVFLFPNLKTFRIILMTLLAGFQVSDRCPLGYMFLTASLAILYLSTY